MAIVGFDPETVNSSINLVNKEYKRLIETIGNKMQVDFVNAMSDKWACNYAQTFFSEKFKPSSDIMIQSANTIFESVINTMNEAARAWAAQTDTVFVGQQFVPMFQKIDISNIKENINGVRGIDTVEAKNIAAVLPVISEEAKNALTGAQQAVQNSGFLGGNQEANLIDSLTTVKNRLSSLIEDITQNAKIYIEKTTDEYNATEQKISKSFESQ